MDAPDDRDIKFQRASGDLLQEFEEKLTPLLWRQNTIQSQKTVHRWSQAPKESRLIEVVSEIRCPIMSAQPLLTLTTAGKISGMASVA